MHDPLSLTDLVTDELRQRRESGFDVADLAGEIETMEPAPDPARLEGLLERLGRTRRSPGWGHREPEGWAEIEAELPDHRAGALPEQSPDLDDRILGGWLGRVAGCNLGKPFETGEEWTPTRIRAYLELAGAWPLRDYVPVLDPMPARTPALHWTWPQTTRGRVRGSARDDDIDYTILALDLLERHGPDLRCDHVATAWLTFLPYLQVYTAERAVYANLLRGVPPEHAADRRNPWREWIGALIRGDAYGWVLPGRPREAARLAHVDASLSHRANGVYGELWAAALVSAATVAGSVAEAYDAALTVVPQRSRLAEVLLGVRSLRAAGRPWEESVRWVRAGYGHYSWVHTVNNAGLIAAGLLWGEDDFAATVGLTVQGGWDTDSNGATAGAVAGSALGARRLPAHLVDPLQDRTRSAVFGYDHSRISELAARTAALARRWPRSGGPGQTGRSVGLQGRHPS